MSIPGFNAETSLYKSGGHYATVFNPNLNSPSLALPAAPAGGGKDGGVGVGARWTNAQDSQIGLARMAFSGGQPDPFPVSGMCQPGCATNCAGCPALMISPCNTICSDACHGGNCFVSCCLPDQTCCRYSSDPFQRGYICTNLTTDPQNCGACLTACAPGQICRCGNCVNPTSCSNDLPTAATVAEAQAAIAAGALVAPLSPGGCYCYRARKTADGTLIGEQFLFDGSPVLTFQHTTSSSIGLQDEDGDGIPEWRTEATRGATPDQNKLVVTKFMSGTTTPTERTTYTYTGGTMHVVYETDEDSTGLQVHAQYDGEPYVASKASPIVLPIRPATSCSAGQCDPAALKQQLYSAFDKGINCLIANGAFGLASRVLAAFAKNRTQISCASIPPVDGQAVRARTFGAITLFPLPYPLDLLPKNSIEVNQDLYCSLPPELQQSSLFHEIMHLLVPDHEPNKEHAANNYDVDQLYGCEKLCFPPQGATQCSCAVCLETTKCDNRCSTALGFLTCSDDFGAWCPCLNKLRWYDTCTHCLEGCPTGLACFGISTCVPVNRYRCTPTTCP